MFERYTEKARRVIFFARYEASQFGSPYIETEHLLLGLLREDKALANRFLRSHAAVESIRKQIEGHTTIREKVSTSVDLPLSHECKRVLAYGAEEAERLNHKHIGTEHLLLGLLREEKCFAAEILHERGLRLSTIREELARSQSEKVASARPKESSLLAEFSRDLTQAAMDNTLDPLIGRDAVEVPPFDHEGPRSDQRRHLGVAEGAAQIELEDFVLLRPDVAVRRAGRGVLRSRLEGGARVEPACPRARTR